MTNEIETVNTETVSANNLPIKTESSQEIQAVEEPKMQPRALTMWNDSELFDTSYKMAQVLAKSEIVPQNYRGKTADCLIAIDMANRMGLSPIVIMQNSQIVRGNFSWKGTACKAMIDSCGKYVKSRYVEVGERGADSWGYYLEAIGKDGTVVKGITVDIATAKAEGWYQKDGSKWKTMPELMLKYRAAAFFFRTECASLAMGFLTAEENEDIAKVSSNRRTTQRVAAPAPAPDTYDEDLPWTDEPEPIEECDGELICKDCGAEISEKVYNYSLDKFGKPLCYPCQKNYK